MDVRAWRIDVRARLAQERARLLFELVGLDEGTLVGADLGEGVSPKSLLLRRAEADSSRVATIHAIRTGRPSAHASPPMQDPGSLAASVAAFLDARTALLDALAALPDDAITPHDGTGSEDAAATVAGWIEESCELDREAAESIQRWRAREHPPAVPGPLSILIAAIRAARKELLTALSQVPAAHRPALRLDEAESLEGALRRVARDEARLITELTDEENIWEPPTSWNATWRRFHDTHHRLLSTLATPPGAAPTCPTAAVRLYSEICNSISRDRSIAAAIRRQAPLTARESRDAP